MNYQKGNSEPIYKELQTKELWAYLLGTAEKITLWPAIMDYRKDAHLSGTTEKGIMCPAIRNYRKENTVPTYKELQER